MSLPRTQETLEQLEKAVVTNCGDLGRACRDLGVSVYGLHQWCLADPSIAEAIKAAQLVGYTLLETEAHRRAVRGVREAVYYKGDIVGYKRVYSDGLLSQMLKARVPGYSSSEEGHRGLTVNVAIMPRADTYEEWLGQRDIALANVTVNGASEASVVHRDEALKLTDQTERQSEPAQEEVTEYEHCAVGGGLPDVL